MRRSESAQHIHSAKKVKPSVDPDASNSCDITALATYILHSFILEIKA